VQSQPGFALAVNGALKVKSFAKISRPGYAKPEIQIGLTQGKPDRTAVAGDYREGADVSVSPPLLSWNG
jgi:hypothetical protein